MEVDELFEATVFERPDEVVSERQTLEVDQFVDVFNALNAVVCQGELLQSDAAVKTLETFERVEGRVRGSDRELGQGQTSIFVMSLSLNDAHFKWSSFSTLLILLMC